MNHSVEFVNSDGDHTNKIEGNWRHVKASLPKYGVKKYLFSSYLAEFMWRRINRDSCEFAAIIRDISSVTDSGN